MYEEKNTEKEAESREIMLEAIVIVQVENDGDLLQKAVAKVLVEVICVTPEPCL